MLRSPCAAQRCSAMPLLPEICLAGAVSCLATPLPSLTVPCNAIAPRSTASPPRIRAVIVMPRCSNAVLGSALSHPAPASRGSVMRCRCNAWPCQCCAIPPNASAMLRLAFPEHSYQYSSLRCQALARYCADLIRRRSDFLVLQHLVSEAPVSGVSPLTHTVQSAIIQPFIHDSLMFVGDV